MNCSFDPLGWARQAIDIGWYDTGYTNGTHKWVCDTSSVLPEVTNTLTYTGLGWIMIVGACAGILVLTFRDKIKKVFVD